MMRLIVAALLLSACGNSHGMADADHIADVQTADNVSMDVGVADTLPCQVTCMAGMCVNGVCVMDAGSDAMDAADISDVPGDVDPATVSCRAHGDQDCAFLGGDYCTGIFICDTSSGHCVAGPPAACLNDDNACTQDSCTVVQGQPRCTHTATVNYQTDMNNCGTCGHACQTGSQCCAGACNSCPLCSETLCGSQCVDLSDDPGNCGSCGHVCSGSASSCAGGTCA
jgi:hypothetical protein